MNREGMIVHVADLEIFDFNEPREFYEFHLPSPVFDLSYLLESLEFELDLDREMFIHEPIRDDYDS